MSATIVKHFAPIYSGNPLLVRGTCSRGLSGVTLTCTIKTTNDLADPGIAQCSTTDGGIVVQSDTEFEATFDSSVTATWPSKKLYYDVQAEPGDGEVYTPMRGTITMRRRVTLALSNKISAIGAPLVPAYLGVGFGINLSFGESSGLVTVAPYTAAGVGGATCALDLVSVAPRACWSIRRRLLFSYTGPLVRVRKTTGGDVVTTQDIGYGLDNALDLSALATFVGSESWAIVQLYDHTGNGRHLSQATAAQQPLGGIAGAPATIDGTPAVSFDGVQRLERSDSLGMSGATAISVWISNQYPGLKGGFVFGIGADANYQELCIDTSGSTAGVYLNAAEKVFTVPGLVEDHRKRWIARLGAGQPLSTAKIMLNGVELVEVALVDGVRVLTLGTAYVSIGCASIGGANFPYDGFGDEAAVWDVDLSVGDLARVSVA